MTSKKTAAAAIAIARNPAFLATEPNGSANGRPGTFIEALACLPDSVECIGYTPVYGLNPLDDAFFGRPLCPTLFSLDQILNHAVMWASKFRRMRGSQWRTVTVDGQTFIINVHSRRPVEFVAAHEDDERYPFTIGVSSKSEYRNFLIDIGNQMTPDELNAEVDAFGEEVRRDRNDRIAAFWAERRRACNDTSGEVDVSNAQRPVFGSMAEAFDLSCEQKPLPERVRVNLDIEVDANTAKKLISMYLWRLVQVEELGGEMTLESFLRKTFTEAAEALEEERVPFALKAV